jgi:hypothetical protein
MVARLASGLTPRRANAALIELTHSYAATFADAYPQEAGWHFSCEQIVNSRC